MSDDTITDTPAEQNPWYQLALKRHENGMQNHFWNGYVRHLMENNGKKAEADKVRVIGSDRRKVGLPKLTSGELKEVQTIIGPLASKDEISFAGCVFDNNADFESFYFPTDVTFSDASFKWRANFKNARFAKMTDFSKARFENWGDFTDARFEDEVDFTDARFADLADFTDANFEDEVDFGSVCFKNIAGFSKVSFAGIVVFSKVSFKDWADFSKARFKDWADFSEASFEELANFTDASFAGDADFGSVSFKNIADFSKASFAGTVVFSKASFEDVAIFMNASFADKANFMNASFDDKANFTDASFAGEANFKNARFAGEVNFKNARFADEADFSASSDTPPHKASVSFASATFKLAPSFFERQLHEDTDWQDVIWPGPSSKERAGDDVRRYERLSLMMSRLEKYDDMHRFFRLSMRAKEIRDGRWSFASIMSRIYGFLFDYGWGFERAFSLWFVHIVLGSLFIIILLQCKDVGQAPALNFYDVLALNYKNALALNYKNALMLSFSNAHSFIGFHSGAQASLYKDAGVVSCFNFIWGAQTVVGLPLLFFLLLTIRNRFRMR